MRLLEFKKCPLCANKKYKKKISCYSNRYSEEIAKFFKVKESYILKKIHNVECTKCGLIYKKYWFTNKNLFDLFNKIIPVHPKCSDKFSNKFSKKYFLKIFSLYIKEPTNSDKYNMYKRTIFSIVDSIQKNKTIKNRFIFFLSKDKKSKLLLLKSKILNLITTPENYKRFSGYDSENFFNFINNRKKLNNYAELGCPNWGMLERAKKNGLNTTFISGDKNYFWTCKKKIKDQISNINNLNKIKKKLDFLGIFFYLDHIKKINIFIKNALSQTYLIGFLLEKIDKKGVAIQHFTGWNLKSIKYLAKKFNKKVDYNFKEISKSNINFYLLY
jgi:hypothetical protein